MQLRILLLICARVPTT